MYHSRGMCRRGADCPFEHKDNTPAAAAHPKAEAKGKPKANAGHGGNAVVKAMVALATAVATIPAVTGHPLGSTRYVEFIADSGAGEHLGSLSALSEQGIDEDFVNPWIGSASKPLSFLTGGGQKAGDQTVGFWVEELGRVLNTYMLKSCPMALSVGQLVAEDFSFVWTPDALPFLVPPNVPIHVEVDRELCVAANRVDHCVPIFRFPVGPKYGMPAPASGPSAEPRASGLEDPRPAAGMEYPVLRPDDPDRAQGSDDVGEEVWSDELGPNHCITHLPKSSKCNICKQAKLLGSWKGLPSTICMPSNIWVLMGKKWFSCVWTCFQDCVLRTQPVIGLLRMWRKRFGSLPEGIDRSLQWLATELPSSPKPSATVVLWLTLHPQGMSFIIRMLNQPSVRSGRVSAH